MLHIEIEKPLQGSHGEMMLDVSLEIGKGSFVALSGVSGSGKTTLLRVLAGLEEAKGSIRMHDAVWQDVMHRLSPQQRKVGFVFQDYALFPHMSIEAQLLYVDRDYALAKMLMQATGLLPLKDRKPESLSGGQQQRVALCRALMRRPVLLLMDEPFSALDPQMRRTLQQEILALHRTLNVTTIMVSHDPREMYTMAERIVMLEEGKVIADGSPKEVLLHTSGSQKFSFVGEILELRTMDVITVAIVAIGQQITEIVIGQEEASALGIGDKVSISTKAFAPTLTLIKSRL